MKPFQEPKLIVKIKIWVNFSFNRTFWSARSKKFKFCSVEWYPSEIPERGFCCGIQKMSSSQKYQDFAWDFISRKYNWPSVESTHRDFALIKEAFWNFMSNCSYCSILELLKNHYFNHVNIRIINYVYIENSKTKS